MTEMTPDTRHHNPDPSYLRELVAQVGLSQREIARRLGVNESQFRRYLLPMDRATYREAPYLLQFAVECWAAGKASKQTEPGQHIQPHTP
jgi:transcriptional regulator with XRE-family HTH domain